MPLASIAHSKFWQEHRPQAVGDPRLCLVDGDTGVRWVDDLDVPAARVLVGVSGGAARVCSVGSGVAAARSTVAVLNAGARLSEATGSPSERTTEGSAPVVRESSSAAVPAARSVQANVTGQTGCETFASTTGRACETGGVPTDRAGCEVTV